jgi:hypothetical protein
VFGGADVLQAWQLVSQLGGLVDQDGQVLRANPASIASILDLDQGHVVLVKLTDDAGGYQRVCHILLFAAERRAPGCGFCASPR